MDACRSRGRPRAERPSAAHDRHLGRTCTNLRLHGTAFHSCRAVTHWSYCAELARRFPKVRVESDPIFVRDGSVWSSAGVTAGIDLALALVEEDLGPTLALAVARYLVVFMKRPGGQAQFRSPGATGLTPARAIERLRVEAARRLLSESDLPAKRISQRCGFGSEETMRRSFLRLLAGTPQDYRSRFRG